MVSRTITSISWNAAINIVQIIVGVGRSILLTRLLPVETFGVYAWAGAIVVLTSALANFGMGDAFLHRAPETEDEDRAAAVYFTLQTMFSSIWAALLIIGGSIFARGEQRFALISLTVITAGIHLTQVPNMILARRVVHRRLALLQLTNMLLSSLAALLLAWQGHTLTALLCTDLITLIINVLGFYTWKPVWKPHFAWSPKVMKYFLGFGRQNVIAIALWRALDKVDDLWTGTYMNETALGFYSRAYTFATYPRKILASPVNLVTAGTYAELKNDRKRLSRAFFNINALLLRSGFLLAGVLALFVPDFVHLVLGVKWLPMLDAFRLMLVYTLLDPVKLTIAQLLVAVGRPDKVLRARGIQLTILIIGLFILGPRWGITGVAIAVDIMLVLGIGILLLEVRTYVDFSIQRLFLVPCIALVLGLVLGAGSNLYLGITEPSWGASPIKLVIFSIVYGVVLLIFEKDQIKDAFTILIKLLLNRSKQSTGSSLSQEESEQGI